MKRSDTFKEFASAFAKFQSEVQNPKLTADNPYFKSKYAPLDEVLRVVRPELTKHGLSIFQDVSTDSEKPDHVVITTLVMHESGEWLQSDPLVLPGFQKLKDGRTEFNAQGAGSSITYAKRYQLQAALGIAADSDDDGEVSVGRNQYQAPAKPQPQSNAPSDAQIAAKYQLVMGSREGLEDYVKKLHDQGKDNSYIMNALDKAFSKKQKEKQQQGA
jgi:hypothetical protein